MLNITTHQNHQATSAPPPEQMERLERFKNDCISVQPICNLLGISLQNQQRITQNNPVLSKDRIK